MDSLKSLLPRDKFDNSTIDNLSQLTDNEIQPIIGNLIECLQDYNWPIAKDILPIVVLHQNVAMTHILDILQGNDVMWQYWIIELVIPYLISPNKRLLEKELERLASTTITNEDLEIIVEKANWCISFYYAK